jgi:acyl-CoA thioesterase YciA
MFEETTLTHLVMPEDLNPHGTLFGGQLAKWIILAGVITGSQLTGKPEGILLVSLNMNLGRGIQLGHLAVIKSRIAYLGKTSITIGSQVFDNYSRKPAVSSLTVYASVDENEKPFPHGHELPAEYIEKNRDIYEAALKLRKSE